MPPVIDVIGIGADGPVGLRTELRQRVHAAEFLAGGERHLTYFPESKAERFAIRDNLAELVAELELRAPRQRCVVLASGDPLFYGIGGFLHSRLQNLRFEPAVSSMQLAFARFGLPWQDAALTSIHGRDLRATLLPLLGRPLIGIFTQDGQSPALVARFLGRYVDATDESVGYTAFIAENLGGPSERLTGPVNLASLLAQRFGPLNYLILKRQHDVRALARDWRAMAPGIADDQFVRPGDALHVMTRQEVRGVVLAKLLGPTDAGDVAWDIGAGLGTVAVELAVLRPELEVLAVERNPERQHHLLHNRTRFDALNLRTLAGEAPDVLRSEVERPRYVFIGGSGGRLPEILDLVHERLRPGGRLVGAFVTLEHLTLMLERLRAWAWPYEATEVHISRSDALAGLTGLKPQRGVFLVRADQPEIDSE